MPLKEIFLSYVEMQRAANDERSNSKNPAFDPAVRKAYDKANNQKRKVLDEIEKLNNENSDSK
jgi:1,2-phenylacetyl-CoA epoxidase PaaB subunit